MSGDAALAASQAAAGGRDFADHALCGWRVRSVVPLPEVMPWAGDDRPPDVIIRLGSAPPLKDPNQKEDGPVQVGRDGLCRLEFKDVATYLVVAGREVVVEPRTRLDEPALRDRLLGVALGVLCHQRGLFPLHASCVRVGGGAVAFAGRVGVGKSTLAAALVHRGHNLMADDVCAVDLASADPQVRPSFPRLRLGDDAMHRLALRPEGVAQSGGGRRKLPYCVPKQFEPSPAALRGIYLLDRAGIEGPEIQLLEGANAAAMLSGQIYRRRIGFQLGRRPDLLTQVLRIVSRVPVFRCPVHLDLADVEAAAAHIEAHACALRKENAIAT